MKNYQIKIKIQNKYSSTTAVLAIEASNEQEAQDKVFALLNNHEGSNRVLEIKNVEQLNNK